VNSTAVDHPRHEQDLAAPPAVAGAIDRQKWELIKKTVAKDANDSEVAMFLELAHKYDLDPFAKEIWCVKGKRDDGGDGRLLIMVGRDGLRKIAQRNGLDPKGDVVREQDEYGTEWIDSEQDARTGEWEANGSAPFHRVTHKTSGLGKSRGEIVGSWCRVVDVRTGREEGWFEADKDEYRPTNAKKLQYSPWGSQEAVMMAAASERQALRQATPLSGLLVEGEGEINEEIAQGRHYTAASREELLDAIIDNIPEAHQERARDLIDEMNSLAAGSWTPAKIELVFKGKGAYDTSVELAAIEKQIEELQAAPREPEPVEAEVVEEPAGEEQIDGEPDPKVVEEVEALRVREEDLESRYDDAADGTREQEELAIELEQVRDAIREAGFTPRCDAGVEPGPGQDSLL
jgi:phage recombination protein Bet